MPQWSELGLNVTLPLNVSLDLGSDVGMIRLSDDRCTQTLLVTWNVWSQGPMTLGHETMVNWLTSRKGERALRSRRVEEEC